MVDMIWNIKLEAAPEELPQLNHYGFSHSALSFIVVSLLFLARWEVWHHFSLTVDKE